MQPSQFRIEPLESKHNASLLALLLDNRKEFEYYGVTLGSIIDGDHTWKHLVNESKVCLAAVKSTSDGQDKVVGLAASQLIRFHGDWSSSLWYVVSRLHRRESIGFHLAQAVIAYTNEKLNSGQMNFNRYIIHASSDNFASQSLALKLGFEPGRNLRYLKGDLVLHGYSRSPELMQENKSFSRPRY